MTRLKVLFLIVTFLPSTDLLSENWPRFRGSDGSGKSSETGFPVSWTDKDYAWVTELPGYGHSSPIIWGQMVFVTTASNDGHTRILRSLDSQTGDELWNYNMTMNGVHLHKKNSFASGSPVSNDSYVIAAFGDDEKLVVVALNHQGEVQWKTDLGEFISQHGPSTSPVIHKDRVIVAKDMMGPSAVYSLDIKTGEIVWETKREFRRTSYATPIVRTRSDQREEVVCVSGATGVTGLDFLSGEQLWKTEPFPMRTVGSPVVAENLIIATSGSGGSGKMLFAAELDSTGTASLRYQLDKQIPYVPTPIYHNGKIFFILDMGIAVCIDSKTGKEIWKNRIPGKYTGSPILLENRIYTINEDGSVLVLAASEQFEELGLNHLGELSYSTPAVANGQMYLRTQSHLFCLKAK